MGRRENTREYGERPVGQQIRIQEACHPNTTPKEDRTRGGGGRNRDLHPGGFLDLGIWRKRKTAGKRRGL